MPKHLSRYPRDLKQIDPLVRENVRNWLISCWQTSLTRVIAYLLL